MRTLKLVHRKGWGTSRSPTSYHLSPDCLPCLMPFKMTDKISMSQRALPKVTSLRYISSQRYIPNIRELKVPISSKFLFSHLILYFIQWTCAKKFFDLDKNRYFYECLKTWKSYFLAVDPSRWSQHRHAQSCDVDSGMGEFRLDLSRLFYLCKFCFVVHAKCSFPAFCMKY